MNCKLEKQINHKKIREQFRQTYIECPLFATKDVGMTSLGVICGGCCLRIQQLLDFKKDLLLRQIFSKEDYKRNPEIIIEYLPEHLNEYYQAIKKLGKNLNDAESECGRCKSTVNKPIYASEKTEMTECGKDDLR